MKKFKVVLITCNLFLIAAGLFAYNSGLFHFGTAGVSQQELSLDSSDPASLGNIQTSLISILPESNVLMNDPSMKMNWAMDDSNAGSINSAKAWQISQGSRDIVVAIIDTGIDANHPDLKNNLWKNPKAGKAGFKGDIHGWNFVENNSDLTDNHGHGTHIAGIIGAEGGNGIGISGVAPRVSLMILKYYDPKARYNNNLTNTIRAIHYAIDNGANIINYSGGGLEYSQEEHDAIVDAQKKGILFIAASGNEYSNSDLKHYYPADYGLDNIISVTAISPEVQVLPSSNFGMKTVNIAAPGKNIFSTLPGNKYGTMTGTSQATAFVSGVAALILSNNREFDYHDLKAQILNTADYKDGLLAKTSSAGKLNSWAALAIQPKALTLSGIKTKMNKNFYATSDSAATEPQQNMSDLNKVLKAMERMPMSKDTNVSN